MSRRSFSAGALGAASLLGLRGASAAPLEIKIGWAQPPHHIIPLLLMKPELLKNYGKTYTVNAIRFQGSTPQIQGLASGRLDIAAFGSTVLALAVTNAGIDAKVVADVMVDGEEGFFSQQFVVRADSDIKTVGDLKGRRIATNAIGSAGDIAMKAYLEANGLKTTDYSLIEVNVANMPAMLVENKVDLINLQPMFVNKLNGLPYRVLYHARDFDGRQQSVHLCTTKAFIDQNRPILVDFFEDYMRGLRWFIDPKNHQEAVAIAAQFLKLPTADLEYAFTPRDFYRSRDLVPDLASMQRAIDKGVELGILKKGIVVDPDHADLSIIKEAKARLDRQG
jgi:NitT/TauT family transport system substrate-binding protein